MYGFVNGWHVSVKRNAGGISLLWNEALKLTNLWNTYRVIGGSVLNNRGVCTWQFLACHGIPYNH